MTARYCGTGRQRRLDLVWASEVIRGGDGLLAAGVLCFLLPVLLAQTILGEAVIVRWVAWSVAAMGGIGMMLLRVGLAVWLAPRQATGAAVEAMVMQGPDEGLIPFSEQAARQVLPGLLQPASLASNLEKLSRAAESAAWQRIWRRSMLPAVFDALDASTCFLARRLPEPLS